MTSQVILHVDGVSYAFGDNEVLKSVGLNLKKAQIAGLLGRNGSGKSTLLSILSGNLPKQSGTITVAGHPLETNKSDWKQELGVIFQSPSLDQKLSARENLELACILYAVPKSQSKEKIDWALKVSQLENRQHDLVKTFSGGMKRRLDIARALLADPKLLLMDEPTTGLDELAFRETWDVLNNLVAETGLSILVATHRPEEAEKCHVVGVLSKGKLVKWDSPEALKQSVKEDTVIIGTIEGAEDKVASVLEDEFSVKVRKTRQTVTFESNSAHTLSPRVAEKFQKTEIISIQLRPSGMAEAFVALTGEVLL